MKGNSHEGNRARLQRQGTGIGTEIKNQQIIAEWITHSLGCSGRCLRDDAHTGKTIAAVADSLEFRRVDDVTKARQACRK